MKRIAMVLFCLLALGYASWATAVETATPEECIQKAKEAADYLSKEVAKGPDAEKAALSLLNQKEGNPYVWKDTYIWVLCCQCNPVTNAAHPINQKIVGPDLSGMKDKQDNLIYLQFCEAAKESKGGWVEYWWPKVGEKKPSRKVAYVLQVTGSPYQVAAGVYDDNISLDELNRMLQ